MKGAVSITTVPERSRRDLSMKTCPFDFAQGPEPTVGSYMCTFKTKRPQKSCIFA